MDFKYTTEEAISLVATEKKRMRANWMDEHSFMAFDENCETGWFIFNPSRNIYFSCLFFDKEKTMWAEVA